MLEQEEPFCGRWASAGGVCKLSGAPVATEGFQGTDIASRSCGDLAPQIRVLGSRRRLKGPGETVPHLSLGVCTVGRPWFAAVRLQSLSLSSRGFSLCVCLSSRKGTSHVGFRTLLMLVASS